MDAPHTPLKILLIEEKETLSRRAEVMWTSEVEPGFFISGFRFLPEIR